MPNNEKIRKSLINAPLRDNIKTCHKRPFLRDFGNLNNMAWVFSLSAECGNVRESAESFTTFFQGLVLTLSDGVEVICQANVFSSGKGWWSLVNPSGVIISGGNETNYELCKAIRATEIGYLLYEQLKSAPPFRYAIVGWEVDGFRDENELDADDLETLSGLVLSQEICEKLNGQSKLQPFAVGYYWQPYKGESWQPYEDEAK